jgi:hypothetical protein
MFAFIRCVLLVRYIFVDCAVAKTEAKTARRYSTLKMIIALAVPASTCQAPSLDLPVFGLTLICAAEFTALTVAVDIGLLSEFLGRH